MAGTILKDCNTCRYCKLSRLNEPCWTCIFGLNSVTGMETKNRWKSVEQFCDEVIEQTCCTCGHDINKPREVCSPCMGLKENNWQPQGDITVQFTRDDLTHEIHKSCDDIKSLFTYKNQDYGMQGDAFANFRKTAERIIIPFMERHGVLIDIKEAMYLVLSVYVDKHNVALSQTGLQGHEAAERLKDIATYSMIAQAMMKGE